MMVICLNPMMKAKRKLLQSMSQKLYKYLNGSPIKILLNQSSTSLLLISHSFSRRLLTSSFISSRFKVSHKEPFVKATCYNITTCGTSHWKTLTSI